jgi:enterochelin esterase family protein
VNFPDRVVPSVALAKNAQGLWSVTLGPFEPNLYEYQYIIDGVTMAEPGNGYPKPQREIITSLVLVPGNPPDFLDLREDVRHGTVHEEFYRSRVLNEVRPLLVYTPPGYERYIGAPLPALYLYHGYGDTLDSWMRENLVNGRGYGLAHRDSQRRAERATGIIPAEPFQRGLPRR